jgi:tetratricopeptide (TPR) repeat protein
MRKAGWTEEDIYLVADRGYSLHTEGHYREAAMIFEGLIAVDPENRYCRDALAAAWLAMGEPQRAIEQLNMLLSRRSDDLAARVRRFAAYLQAKQYGSALADFEVLKRLLPRNEGRRLELSLQSAISKTPLSGDSR